MAASSSSAFLAMRDENEQQQQLVPPSAPAPAGAAPSSNKRRRNQPGNPNPDAEVIALSPKTLMATNRFVCEVCNKGFQREQNLQLHRRGHNLPWKLRQKSSKEVRRKVYLCPEPSCVHHDPARALGDLTGIKKHYSRKHGEKKYKCEKCSKKYAVHSDWKAHSKTCGTREYRCDCGTLFSRRDSFITHRAFCDALAQESARNLNPPSLSSIGSHLLGLSQQDQINPSLSSHDILRLGSGTRPTSQYDQTLVSPGFRPSPRPLFLQPQGPNHDDQEQQSSHGGLMPNKPSLQGLMQLPQLHMNNANTNSSSSTNPGLFNLSFFPGNTTTDGGNHHSAAAEDSTLFSSGNLMSIAIPSLYSTSHAMQTTPGGGGGQMSATALLQKAAQMGSSTSNAGASSSLLKSFGKSPDPHSFGGYGGNNNGSHLHELVNSIAAAGGSSASMFGGAYGGDHEQAEIGDYRGFHGSNNQQRFSSLEQAGRLTRDFLGVGEIVRSVRDQQSGMDHINSLDSQGKTASHSHSQAFGGGNFQ